MHKNPPLTVRFSNDADREKFDYLIGALGKTGSGAGEEAILDWMQNQLAKPETKEKLRSYAAKRSGVIDRMLAFGESLS